jgi:polar amino acid transport system substrate-binding protein
MSDTRFPYLAALLCALTMAVIPAAAQTSTLAEIKQKGILKAGIKVDTPLFCFADEKGKPAGFDIDLVTDLARRLGVKLELVVLTSATRVQALAQKRIDLIACTLTHYRDRDRVIDLSVGYFYTPQTLLVKKGSGIKSVADMAGKRLGTTIGAGTANYFLKAQPQAKVQTFEGWAEAFFALQRGLVDAVGTDMTILAGLRANAPDSDNYEILLKPGQYSGSEYGFGVRENDSKWRDEINFALQDMWVDGTWDRAFTKWLGADSILKLSKAQLEFQMTVWP